MDLDDYTTCDDVRSLLGVDDAELKDATITLDVNLLDLEDNLYAVAPDLTTTFLDIKAKDEELRSVEEAQVFRLTKLFATYSLAHTLATSLPMFGPKSMTDNKASFSRFSGEPYEKVLSRILDRYAYYRDRLLAALEDLNSTEREQVVKTHFVAVGSAYDPVTG